MKKPLLLDAFCGVGGSAVGYSRAGFEVVGVDRDPQPNYPFPFLQADALEALTALLAGEALRFRARDGWVLEASKEHFRAAHASPPCQGYTALKAVHGNEWPRLVEPVRDLLGRLGLSSVMENVQGSPVRRDIVLCGEMFGLSVIRHRYFELGGWSTAAPEHRSHRGRVAGMRHGKWYEGPYFAVYGEGGGKGSVAQWQDAMDIHWTDVRREIAEAVPPQYTEWVGARMLEAIGSGRSGR